MSFNRASVWSCVLISWSLAAIAGTAVAQGPAAGTEPGPRAVLFRSVELNVGETGRVELADGRKVEVKLLELNERRDSVNGSMRSARIKIEIDGRTATIESGNYNLPRQVGSVQVDCPCTKGYIQPNLNPWGLGKDARLRLWPAGSPWARPGTFLYPVKQAWFASDTQMGNEPVFVDGGELPGPRKSIYYHRGLDFGGAEGMVEVVAAAAGTVVIAGTESVDIPEPLPTKGPRYDAVLIRGDDGMYYRYSHLLTIDPEVKVEARVSMGRKIGVLGKEGTSGGWSHLHFEVFRLQPSGKWGSEDAYAFAWEAYLAAHKPEVIAVARPHRVASVDQAVILDAGKSWSRQGGTLQYEWTLSDGTRASTLAVERVYEQPGTYSEILKVADEAGRFDYDFVAVQILDSSTPDRLPPTIHAAFAPTTGIRPGDEVTFKVRSFRCGGDGLEVWDFGDGSPPVNVQSDCNAVKHAMDGYAVTTHRYERPGDYLVNVKRSNQWGHTATARLHVRVETE